MKGVNGYKMAVLSVKNLSFDYSDTKVLKDISFSLYKGEFLGIIGSNGTGKSTLIKLILGLLDPVRGEINVNCRCCGYVSQKAASFNSAFPATVGEVVSANLYEKKGLFRRIKKSDMQKVYESLERVGMNGFENKLIGKLSGGQQQRVFIARALVSEPDLLILDEPTVGIDAKSVCEITSLIRELNESGITIIMTNHDTHSLIKLADKILALNEDGSADIVEKKQFGSLD